LTKLGHKVLDKTMRIDTGTLDVPVFISLYTPEASMLTGTKKQMGKGASPEQSEASALMELAERYSFWSFIRTRTCPCFTPA
jgi:ribosomal protein S12 methylthiotransferase accessory factor